ncbi:MAG TPA: helix-turn-helix domain-containing protein [Candidatus Acidoferrales bacterium]|nr:helix-turn-helix domain-containing protein [Candidatus Acidoferrales bacterium]
MAALEYFETNVAVESRDSPLGRWTVARWSPPDPSPLRGIVEQIWYFDGTLARARERLFPDGSAELIVQLDDPHCDGTTKSPERFPAVCINGLRTGPAVVVAPPGRCRVLGIRFDPFGAAALLRSSMKHLVDVTIDVHDGIGRAAAELAERCADAVGTPSRDSAQRAAAAVSTAERWLVRELHGRATPEPAVAWAANLIRATGGRASVDGIAREVGFPRARLARRFDEALGVTPKRFARIVRFHRALDLLRRGEGIAGAAASLAYHDQAHMYRDFAEFAGMTPGEFLSATHYPNTPSLAEP